MDDIKIESWEVSRTIPVSRLSIEPPTQSSEPLVDRDLGLIAEVPANGFDIEPVGGGELMDEKPGHCRLSGKAEGSISRFHQGSRQHRDSWRNTSSDGRELERCYTFAPCGPVGPAFSRFMKATYELLRGHQSRR